MPSLAHLHRDKNASEDVPSDLPFSVLLLRGIIAGLGMVLVAGFTGLIMMLSVTFYRLYTEQNATRWPQSQKILLEKSQSITGSSLSGKYLVLQTQKEGKPDTLLIHDTSTGQLATTIQISQDMLVK